MRSKNPEVRARAMEKMREYYHRTKKPWECECGRIIESGRKDKHLKTEIHAVNMPTPLPTPLDFQSFFHSK
jgi:hypothetical protein